LKEETEALRKQRQKINVKDFKVITVIGKGAFGEVRIVREKSSKKVFAMKTMRKKDMVAKNQVTHIQAERDLMAAADNTWLVKLFFSFQDDTYLYLVMEYCGGGDLMTILMREDILSEQQTRFYMSELAISINAVHELDFVHRDLKPDNILIANTGHIKLSDFGLAKSFNTSNDSLISKFHKKASTLKDEDAKNLTASKARASYRNRKNPQEQRKKMYSTVGTPDYIAPEVFSQKGYDKMVDWWSMGVIMFECLVGYPPFYAEDPLQTCRKIVHYRKYFKIPPDANLSREAIDLIHNLVCSHRRRFGFDRIKTHPFFQTCPWHDLQTMTPPFKPKLKSDVDASNFDKIESEQIVQDKYKPSKATDKTHFWGYTFNRPLDMKSIDVQKIFAETGDVPPPNLYDDA
jgi:serine/threonine kinase 38